jgi:hypothetical protein
MEPDRQANRDGLTSEDFLSTGFWIKRFLTVLLGAFAIICGAQLLRGHDVAYSPTQAAIWSTLSALTFTISRFFQARRGQCCAICKDTPDAQEIAAVRSNFPSERTRCRTPLDKR